MKISEIIAGGKPTVSFEVFPPKRDAALEPVKTAVAEMAKSKEYDLLIGMDSYNIADLKRLVYPEDRSKIRRMLEFANINRDVADPWYAGNFDATWDDVLAGCTGLLKSLS